MNAPHVTSSLSLLTLVRQETDAIGAAVSFGKDSLATLDLCCRVFTRVEGYYLYRVRGLEIVEGWADEVYRRHGVRVRMYPHFDLSRCYRAAVLQPHWSGLESVPQIGLADIEAQFRKDANIDWMAMGWRKNDSFSRALIMKKCRGFDPKFRRVFPLRSWRRSDVFSYLETRGIKLPPSMGRKEQAGLDFHPGALEMLKAEYPRDWERWVRDFPFSESELVGAQLQRDSDGPTPETDQSGEGLPAPTTTLSGKSSSRRRPRPQRSSVGSR